MFTNWCANGKINRFIPNDSKIKWLSLICLRIAISLISFFFFCDKSLTRFKTCFRWIFSTYMSPYLDIFHVTDGWNNVMSLNFFNMNLSLSEVLITVICFACSVLIYLGQFDKCAQFSTIAKPFPLSVHVASDYIQFTFACLFILFFQLCRAPPINHDWRHVMSFCLRNVSKFKCTP